MAYFAGLNDSRQSGNEVIAALVTSTVSQASEISQLSSAGGSVDGSDVFKFNCTN